MQARLFSGCRIHSQSSFSMFTHLVPFNREHGLFSSFLGVQQQRIPRSQFSPCVLVVNLLLLRHSVFHQAAQRLLDGVVLCKRLMGVVRVVPGCSICTLCISNICGTLTATLAHWGIRKPLDIGRSQPPSHVQPQRPKHRPLGIDTTHLVAENVVERTISCGGCGARTRYTGAYPSPTRLDELCQLHTYSVRVHSPRHFRRFGSLYCTAHILHVTG